MMIATPRRSTNPRTLPRGAAARLAALLVATTLFACGGVQRETATPEPGPEKTAEAPKPEPSAQPAGPDAEAAATCIATANAKRARFSGEPAKITARHILVKYAGAKKADAAITRTREEACLRALEARDKLREGSDFDEMVKQYSEEAGAASRGGTVGTVERTDLAKAFADAAFELSINQMSDVVETEFGFHLILRTE